MTSYDGKRIIIDDVAIPGDFIDPDHITLELGEAMEYYPSYARSVIGTGGVPLTPQAYTMTIFGLVVKTGKRRHHALDRCFQHYGRRKVLKWLGTTDEQLDEMRIPTAEQEAVSMLMKMPV